MAGAFPESVAQTRTNPHLRHPDRGLRAVQHTPEPADKLNTSVNGPTGLREQVRRLRCRVFKAIQEDLNRPTGLLGPCAWERACTVLRGDRRSNATVLPGGPSVRTVPTATGTGAHGRRLAAVRRESAGARLRAHRCGRHARAHRRRRHRQLVRSCGGSVVSNDGVAWGSPVASGTGSAALVTATFPNQTAR